MKFVFYFCTTLRSSCCCSSGVEHFLGKEEVVSSILINSSQAIQSGGFFCLEKASILINSSKIRNVTYQRWRFLFYISRMVNSRPPKSSFAKGGFRRNVNTAPRVRQHPWAQSSSTAHKPSNRVAFLFGVVKREDYLRWRRGWRVKRATPPKIQAKA